MKKLLIRLGVIALIVFGLRDIYVRYHNLEYYSVYYASKLPHKEGTNPVLVMVAKNLSKVKHLEGNEIRRTGGLSSPLVLKSENGIKISLFPHSIDVWTEEIDVSFDRNTGEYISGYLEDANDVGMMDTQRQQFLSELDEFLADIVAVQEEPKLNLQDWFNAIYEKQFNE